MPITITKNTYGIIKRINGVKPLPTTSGPLSLHRECKYYAICGTTGYIVSAILGKTRDENRMEFDLSDKETATAYCNIMLESLNETIRLPFVESPKLVKCYYEMLGGLEKLHPRITEEIPHPLKDNVSIEDEEKIFIGDDPINEIRLALCGAAKEIIDEVDKMIEEFLSMNVSYHAKSIYKGYVREFLIRRLSWIAAEIKRLIPEDPETSEEVLQYLNNFINEYNHISGMENISIKFMD